MKKINFIVASAVALLSFTSCNDFLDKLPDDRAELNAREKIGNLLTEAYAHQLPLLMMEMSSDNIIDNGKQYTAQPDHEKMYRWQQVTQTQNDSPYTLWVSTHTAVATANEALQDIKMLGDGAEFNGEKAEALLCRAYGMFSLANAFCMAYDPSKAATYLGLAYPTEPEQDVNTKYVRGTLEELYGKINADIEAALPLIDDTHLAGKSPRYHFNRQAAYAFAARFNLYYHKYDKAIQYATEVLGSNPANVLRDFSTLATLSGAEDKNNYYIASGSRGNLLLQTAVSLAGRIYTGYTPYQRFNSGRPIVTYQTFWARGPWGSGSAASNKLYYSHNLYGSDQAVYFPKIREKFEYTDKVNGTGYVHITDAAFTGDETLLVRAEAYALSKQYANAIADINSWIASHCSAGAPTMTEASINTFINGLAYEPVEPTATSQYSIKKTLHPQGFTVEAGTQENIIQLILHMRRLETVGQGLRFQDLKRYGIEFSHKLDGEATLVFKAGDLRGALQLPEDVIQAGLARNPR